MYKSFFLLAIQFAKASIIIFYCVLLQHFNYSRDFNYKDRDNTSKIFNIPQGAVDISSYDFPEKLSVNHS